MKSRERSAFFASNSIVRSQANNPIVRWGSRVGPLLGAAVLGIAVTGCSNQLDRLEKQLGEVQRDLVGVRAQNAALRDRLDALEMGADEAAAKEKEAADLEERPQLAVVRLAPQPSDADAALLAGDDSMLAGDAVSAADAAAGVD